VRKKIPLIEGLSPDEIYDLDDNSHLTQLGLDPQVKLKIADKYVHYVTCTCAVIEFKSSTLGKAIKQIEITVERLAKVGKKVDLAIIEMNRMNTYEQRRYKRNKYKQLVNTWNGKLILVSGVSSSKVYLYLTKEVDKMYRERLQ